MERIPRRAVCAVVALAVAVALAPAELDRDEAAAAAARPKAALGASGDSQLKPVAASRARAGAVELTLTPPADLTGPVRVLVASRAIPGVKRVSIAVGGVRLATFAPAGGRFHGATGTIPRPRLAGGARRVVLTVTRRAAPAITVVRTHSPPAPAVAAPVVAPPATAPPALAPPASPIVAPMPAPAPPPALPARILWGAYIDGDAYGPDRDDPPWDMTALEIFEANAGKSASIVHYGQSWRRNGVPQPFYPGDHQRVRDHGALPLLDWNPWDSSAGGSATQPDFALGRIIAGDHDAYIASWATGARSWGHPLFLRLAHEMNGSWYPWSETRNGNTAGEYVAAWRHVHDIFQAVGATNVTWVWSPNVTYPGSIPLPDLYPGDAYVDWVAMDGYNWGTNPAKPDSWKSFGQVFGPTYDELGALAPHKPVMLAEFGSTEHGGSKAAWIADALTQIPTAFPRIRAAVWFNWDADGMDWRIESSSAAQSAFASGIGTNAYVGGVLGELEPGVIGPP